MRALVTGGAGFIGSHLIDRLVARGDTVVVLDNLSSGKLHFIQGHIDSGNVSHIQGDITNFDTVLSAMEGIDCVFHLAANPDIRPWHPYYRYGLETRNACDVQYR